jgi:hypothetical protein
VLTNAPAMLPKSVEAACELVLPLGPKSKSKKPGDPLTEEEGAKLAGRYKANFKSVIVTRTDDGKLKVQGIAAGIPAGTYTRQSGWRFKGSGEIPMVFVAGADGRARYLYHGGRALVRVEAPEPAPPPRPAGAASR